MIEVREFIKDIFGRIGQVKLYSNGTYFTEKFGASSGEIVKHSKNIIDLIEVGDYVDGYKVISIDYDVIDDETECIELDLNNNYQYNFITSRQIKTICTKQQFAQAEYKIKEDK